MAGTSGLQSKLQAGIEAARRGDRVNAQKLLRTVLDADPNNEVAWMWLASVLDNLAERRQALEQALRINPNNTRAKAALEQLNAVLPPARGQRKPVPTAPAAAPRLPDERGGNSILIIVGVLAALLVLALIIFSLVARTQQPVPPNEETRVAILNTATPTATIDPASYTATPFFGIIVTPASLPTLPPTFTPTFTPVIPTETPTPTAIPLNTFLLWYTSVNAGESQPSLFRMNGDGTGDQPVAPAGFSDIAVSPDQRLMAFVRVVTYDQNGQSVTAPELFIAPLNDLSQARQITTLGSDSLGHPSWAPDSIRLVFSSDYDGDSELWTITEDGNNLLRLTDNDLADLEPAWSPDGSVIVYASEQANGPGTGLTELFSIAPEGGKITQLTDAQGSSYSPSWSPDGKRIAFASDRGGDGDIYIMDSDGQNYIRLTVDDGSAEDRIPAFTPVGSAVIFVSNRAGGRDFQFYQVDLNGRQVVRLVDPGRSVDSFSFRPEPLLLAR